MRNLNQNKKKTKPALAAMLLMGAVILNACGGNAGGTGGTNAPVNAEPETTTGTNQVEAPQELVEVKQITNWFAQAEHGGQYAALLKGFYEEAGLDMEIESGGPGISATQIVASGNAQFGMGQGDEILFARQNGIPLVVLAGIFQKNPQALMFHKGQDIQGFEDLDGRKVYVGNGVAYWEYIRTKYNLDNVEQFAYNGQLASFLEDETAVSQSYMTSEPFTLAQEGIEVDYLLNADSGYMPYGNILFTTEKFLEENPDIVQAYVEASIEGWNYYKDNYSEVNAFIQEFNPDMPIDKLEYSAQELQPLVYGFEAEEHGVGYMTQERWQTLMDQLLELGLLEEAIDVETVYTNEYLPQD
ncbi:ABC transporter substrate-binding protein [Paenibacillus daejeonensis]|uniref:ABC transporter substrate-binding protein n=1 Tax=Paenibacillus daejeonensis TaxID=135193 RepID=UPI000367F667|nr:ABC transporter substrate-binding protein [Paenibacillus daejeonensis]